MSLGVLTQVLQYRPASVTGGQGTLVWAGNSLLKEADVASVPSTLVIFLCTHWCVYTYAGPPGRPALLKGHLPVLNQNLSIFIYLTGL